MFFSFYLKKKDKSMIQLQDHIVLSVILIFYCIFLSHWLNFLTPFLLLSTLLQKNQRSFNKKSVKNVGYIQQHIFFKSTKALWLHRIIRFCATTGAAVAEWLECRLLVPKVARSMTEEGVTLTSEHSFHCLGVYHPSCLINIGPKGLKKTRIPPFVRPCRLQK